MQPDSRASRPALKAPLGLRALKEGLNALRGFGISQARLSPEGKERLNALVLKELAENLKDCQQCALARERTQVVFGEGHPNSELLVVGEGPGRDEDLEGRPFVGAAGQLLTRMLKAIGLEREAVYIGNVVKCRPPQNRNPLPEEMAACLPNLERQIQVLNPRVILAMGNVALQALLKTTEKISRLRGRIFRFGTAWLVPTFHPAFLLRNPEYKRQVWEDLQMVEKLMKGTL
jgi:DNA polymerase